jgi:hypothetical protein
MFRRLQQRVLGLGQSQAVVTPPTKFKSGVPVDQVREETATSLVVAEAVAHT